MKFSSDAVIITLVVLGVCLLGSSIAFILMWRIAVEDRDAAMELYDECIGIDPTLEDELNAPM